MSQKDSSSKIKAQPAAGTNPTPTRKAGSTKYKMQAAQLAQEAAKIAAQQEAQARAQKEAAARGESQSEDTVRGLWKSRVLASYKGKGAKDSNTLLAKISDGKAGLEVGDRHKSVNIQEEMISTVDKMFDVFQNCAYEFNKFAGGTELEINWIRPFLSKEVTKDWHAQENANLIFSGRVSTRRWTMVIKGTTEEVVVFILPADKLIGFALSANNFKPYFVMTPISDKLDVHWQVEEHVMPPELFPKIYKELFDGLIRFAREEAHPDEVFTLRKIGIVPGPETPEAEIEEDQKRQKMYQEQFFQDMRSREDFKPVREVPEFAKPEIPKHDYVKPPEPAPQLHQPQQIQPQPIVQPQQLLYQAPPQPQPQTADSGMWKPVPDVNLHNPENARLLAERAAQQLRANHMQHQQQQPTPQQMPNNMRPAQQAPQAMPPVMPQHAPQHQMQPQAPQHMPIMDPQWPSIQAPVAHASPAQPMAPQQHYAQPGQYPHPQNRAPQPPPQLPPQPVRPATFSEALSALLSCLDEELEVVAKAGSDAFAQRDLARADAALKFSGRLTEFRTLARELHEYYGGKS